VIVNATILVAIAILLETALSYLGFGVPLRTPRSACWSASRRRR
jgi:ABC-type dipeptide/oligopeptide/nickel transport system permease subunit